MGFSSEYPDSVLLARAPLGWNSMVPNNFPTRRLGRDGPYVSAIGLGTMDFSESLWNGKADEEDAYNALSFAADCGMTFWDTSDIYKDSEIVLGKWFKKTGRRNDIFLATKFGAADPENRRDIIDPISKPSYIKHALERSLTRLGTDYIDLYYQHRVDPNVPIEVVLETLRGPVENGTIRWLGLSECSAEVLRRARAVPGIGKRVVACQMEFSPLELEIERNGFAKVAEEEGVAVVAYSPLGRGMLTGRFRSRADFAPDDYRLLMPRFSDENFAKNLEIMDKLKSVADKYGSTLSQIALAWILVEYPNFIPLVGSRSALRIEENAGATKLVLDQEDMRAIRTLVQSADVRGERVPVQYMPIQDCTPLEDWKGE